MNITQVQKLTSEIIRKSNICEEKISFITSADERKKIFAGFCKPYYPAEPDTVCEAVFPLDFSDFRIMIYAENINDKAEFESIFSSVAQNCNEKVKEFSEKADTGKALLRILADYLNGRKSNDVAVTDELRKLSENHEVQGIVYYQTKDEKNMNAYYQAIDQYSKRRKLIKTISESFGNKGIDFYFVKGAKIHEDYPTPQLRTMGDCDIHLKPKDREKASEIMKSLGFSVEILETVEEWKCHKGPFIFELHDSLCYEQDYAEGDEREFLVKEWDYVHNNELEDEFHFIYLLSHLKKHLTSRGVGFRQFMDLAVEIGTGRLDLDKVLKYSETAGLKDFLLVCMTLCEKWFEISMPFRTELSDEFVRRETFRVTSNGVFGFQKEKDEEKDYSKLVNYEGRFRTFITSIFPPYKTFISIEEYSWLRGKKFLLPIAWIIRIFRKALNSESRKKSVYKLNKITASQNINSEFSEWGIK